MDELTVFEQREVLGKDFKIYGSIENPLFLAKDVASWIEHKNITMMLKTIDEDEKIKIRPKQSLGLVTNNNEYWFLTEDGLYEVLMQSRKPIAKQFKKQVKTILKTIRKHGAYMNEEVLEKALTSPEFLIQLATQLKKEKEQRAKLEKTIEVQKPKVLFAESVNASQTTILVNDLAKLIKQNGVNIGGRRLFEWMRENGYLIKRKGTDWNMPTQYSMELKLFEIKETTHTSADGQIRITKTPKVTGKGQEYFINKFLTERKQEVV